MQPKKKGPMNRSSIYRVLAGVWCLAAVAGPVSAEALQVNAAAQQKAVEDARVLVPDTLNWDFSELKEIYLDEFAILNDFEDGMLCIKDAVTGKVGFLNPEGEWAIPVSLYLSGPQNNAPTFENGYCVCYLRKQPNDKSDLVILDKTGKAVKLPNVEWCSDFTPDGYALAVKNVKINQYEVRKKVVFINPQGQEIMPDIYGTKLYKEIPGSANINAYAMSDGLAPYYDFVTGKWGFFDKSGRKVIPATYEDVLGFSEGVAAVQMPMDSESPMKWGFIDTTGKMVIPARFSHAPHSFTGGRALVQKTNDNYVFIDHEGKVVSEEYDHAEPFYHGYTFVRRVGDNVFCCINTDFEIVRIGEDCSLDDEEYLWNGRQESAYNARIGKYDFTGRRVFIGEWKHKGLSGDSWFNAFEITSYPMVCVHNDTFFGDPVRWAYYADLSGKVKFALYLNEF